MGHSSPLKYKGASIVFAILTAYMLVCAIICIVKVGRTFGTAAYNQMLVSILATYISYIVSSALALDPWHLVTSFWQYALLTSTYINILNV